MSNKLFPEFLNQGSKGPAVALLQCLLINGKFNSHRIIVDGEYLKETAEGVRQCQAQLCVEQDGNFGPETRKALIKNGRLNVNAIKADLFVGETKEVKPQ